MMKNILFLLLFLTITYFGYSQKDTTYVTGTVTDAQTTKPLESVNVVNLNQVKGAATDAEGNFRIPAKVNDTLHFSYLGYKSIRVRVTNDWMKFGNANISMTELALALEEVVVNQLKLTGYLEVDIKQVALNDNYRYSISGLPNTGYEAKGGSPPAVNKVLGAIFNPLDFLHNVFGKKPREMRKLKKMKQDDQIRSLLASRFDREMLMALLQVDRVDLDQIISQCNYSADFIKTANDLQILDAISECYEEYKVLNRSKKRF